MGIISQLDRDTGARSSMIEEEFDIKHLDLIKREINKNLETVGGFHGVENAHR
jgi:hypothetical protein